MAEFIIEREVFFRQKQLVIVEADTAEQALDAVHTDDTDKLHVIDADEKRQDKIDPLAMYDAQGAYTMICAEIDRIWDGLGYGSEKALFNYRGGYYTGRQCAKDVWAKRLKVA